jgi:Domain of unknown function (DUF4386)
MSLDQKRARVFGVLFLITFITSIPALALYQPVLDDPVGYIRGSGHDNQIFAALLELLQIISNIGTAVVIFPIARRQNEELALAYVTGCATRSRRLRGHGRVHPRGDQGLDVPPRPRLGRRLGERADPRLQRSRSSCGSSSSASTAFSRASGHRHRSSRPTRTTTAPEQHPPSHRPEVRRPTTRRVRCEAAQ